ncbi:MAG: GNAT family N-acetyltransferase [Phycisphaerales bacterium]|nr:MAG: GNAT family N-acetyltransferase [Phycisphaerales bacterium]
MSNGGDEFQITRIVAGSAARHAALHLAFDIEPPPAEGTSAAPVADLLASVRRKTVSIDLLLGAYRGRELVTACLAAESPGAAALVFVPGKLETDVKYRATVATLKSLQALAWDRSIVILEVLVAPGRGVLGDLLKESGFRYLTRLRYLMRDATRKGRSFKAAHDLEWVEYAPDRELLFQRTVEETYTQSQDCPELTGLRRTAEVLAGHRATGIFDPALWWVAMRGDKPVGVMLLNRIPHRPVLEVVYMGVAHAARRTGVADALLQRALDVGARMGVVGLSLAVDQRNTPARRMYARWDFVEKGARDAWIVTSPRT